MGVATVNGPQGAFKVGATGDFTLMFNQDNPDDLSVNGQFDNNELHRVDFTLGGGTSDEPDQISYSNTDGLTVNGQPCTANTVTPNGTTITFNGGKVNITSPDGDTFSLYKTDCNPPAINIEGQVASDRPQGQVRGLVGTFDDSIPAGQHNQFNGTKDNEESAAFWQSWAADQIAKDSKADEARRKALYEGTAKGAASAAGEAKTDAARVATADPTVA